MNLKRSVLIPALLLAVAANAGSLMAQVQTTAGTVVADSWVTSAFPNSTTAEGVLAVGYNTTNSYANERALIRFTLPPLPPHAIVTTCVLRTTVTGTSSGTPINVAACQAANLWSESVTWNTSPNYSLFTWATVGGTGTVDWEVTDMVTQWYSGMPNLGFLLISDVEGSGVQNDRVMGNRTSGNPPQLLISYVLPSVSYGSPEIDLVVNNGPAAGRVNLVFLGDGFDASELALYKSITDGLVTALFAVEPYKSLASRFNVTRVNTISVNSGIRFSATDAWSTAFDSYRWDLGGSYAITVPFDRWDTTVTQAIAKAPACDIIMIISNTTSSLDRGQAFLPPYWGTGSHQYRAATSYAGAYADRSVMHELSHAIGSNGDEYDTGQTLDFFPNLSLDGSPSTVKWSKWVGQGDVQSPVPFGTHGLFKTVPDSKCLMNDLLAPSFCLICNEHLSSRILRYSTLPAPADFSVAAGAAAVTSGDALVTWGVDATPASAPGGAVRSAPASLNFNNGTNYDTGSRIRGSATLALLPVQGTADLHFWCNRDTENVDGKDRRMIKFVNEDSSQILHEISSTEFSLADCSPAGTWHEHTVPVAGWWGPVQPRFFFDSVDGGANATTGWFVDDITVVAQPKSSGGGGGGGCGLTGFEGPLMLALAAALRRRRPLPAA